MTFVVLTVWDRAHDDPGVRAILDRVRPQAIQVHCDATVLATRVGERAITNLAKWYPASKLYWGVPGDSHGPDPSAVWCRGYEAAITLGIDTYMLDPEARMKTIAATLTARNAMVRVWLSKLYELRAKHQRGDYPVPRLGHTAFDTINGVTYRDKHGVPHNWGGHGDYPNEGFLGRESRIDITCPQVYAAGAGDAPAGALLTRDKRSRQSFAAAVHAGTLRDNTGTIYPALEIGVYLQLHHTPTDELVTVGRGYKTVCGWAAPTRCDERGLAAMEQLAREYDAWTAGKLVGEAVAAPGAVAAYDGPDVECHDDVDCHPESATHLAEAA